VGDVAASSSFDGTLLEVPFGADTVRSVAVEQYRSLLTDNTPEEVLVLTGSPTSMDAFRAVLGDECGGAAVPRVTSVIVHATEVINRTDDRSILSDEMRRELLYRFIENWDWEHEYFRQAAEQTSFTGDIARLIETATWQDASLDRTAELREIATVRDEFHEWLGEHGQMERSQMIGEATDRLATRATRETLREFDAVLVIEFEEFLEPDRRYLQQLAADRTLVCVAEADASIRRAHAETGPVSEHVSFSDRRTVEAADPDARPAATAAYFATDTVPPDPGTGVAQVLTGETADDELDRVADEIERLRDRREMAYEDIAVALKRSGPSVIEAVETLRQAGIPTTSATVVGFGDDPAIRELLQVVETLATDSHTQSAVVSTDAVLPGALRETVSEPAHLGDALRRWVTESGLKERIAEDATPLDARSQFGNLRRVFAIADFIQETQLFEASWDSLAAVLGRSHEHAPQENQTSALDDDGGVRVDHVHALKNGSFRAVFLLDVVDSTYPGEPMVSRVFPQERVRTMPDYPGVTRVDEGDVAATFATDSTMSSRPFRRYHAEHARRQLAVGAAIASECVYFCLHTHEGATLDRRVQPSRYLTDVYRTLPWVTETGDGAITTDRAAEEYLLSRVDRALADVRRANSQAVTVSLDDIEADFAEIQGLLANSGERGEQLRAVLRARLDIAAGRVRRD
jgi:hypothetical protein